MTEPLVPFSNLQTVFDHIDAVVRPALLALAADFKMHGAAAIEKVREQQPAVYLKICALLVPREMKLEHSGGVKDLTDEQLEQAIAWIKEMLAAQAGDAAKVIEGKADQVSALPPARLTTTS